MAAPHSCIYWVRKKGAPVLTNLNKSDKLTKDSLAQLRAVIMTARKATALHLDNSKLESTAISLPRKDENDMARKRIRREVEIDG